MTATTHDEELAARQGWRIGSTVHLGEEVLTIERLDDPRSVGLPFDAPRFPTDEHAEAYVRGRADAGDEHAQAALDQTSHVYRVVGKLDDWNNVGAR